MVVLPLLLLTAGGSAHSAGWQGHQQKLLQQGAGTAAAAAAVVKRVAGQVSQGLEGFSKQRRVQKMPKGPPGRLPAGGYATSELVLGFVRSAPNNNRSAGAINFQLEHMCYNWGL